MSTKPVKHPEQRFCFRPLQGGISCTVYDEMLLMLLNRYPVFSELCFVTGAFPIKKIIHCACSMLAKKNTFRIKIGVIVLL